MGRNPQTGEPIQIPAKTAVKFRLAKAFKNPEEPPKKKWPVEVDLTSASPSLPAGSLVAVLSCVVALQEPPARRVN